MTKASASYLALQNTTLSFKELDAFGRRFCHTSGMYASYSVLDRVLPPQVDMNSASVCVHTLESCKAMTLVTFSPSVLCASAHLEHMKSP
jgi:hypothetical protein